MKSFITGFKGQLGYDLAKELCKRGENEITVSDRSELDEEINKRSLSLMEKENLNYSFLDITDKDAVMDLIKSVKPRILLAPSFSPVHVSLIFIRYIFNYIFYVFHIITNNFLYIYLSIFYSTIFN